MANFKVNSIQPIMKCKGIKLTDGVYDNESLYFINKNYNYILRSYSSYNYKITTKRIYSKLTYDQKDNCFWALSSDKPNIIFKLDKYMNEIRSIDFYKATSPERKFSSLAYDKVTDRLIVGTGKSIYEVDKKTNMAKNYQNISLEPDSIYPVDQYLLALGEFQDSPYLSVFINSECIQSYKLPNDLQYNSILYSHATNCGDLSLEILANDDKIYNYIITMQIPIGDYKGDTNSCGDHNDCKSDSNCFDGCCENNHCNHDCCNDCCDNSCNKVIESIALVEASIAHILNAEGEKLQKGIKLAKCVDDLLCLNASVESTIIRVTNLEIQLYSKLAEIQKKCRCK